MQPGEKTEICDKGSGGCRAQGMVDKGREAPPSAFQAAREGSEKGRMVWAKPQRRSPQASDDGWRSACGYWLSRFSRSVVPDSVRPVDGSPPGSSVRGILQARIPGWVAISFSSGSS